MAHIRQVTDLRNGLIHPKRHWDGRFMGRKEAARTVRFRNIALDDEKHARIVNILVQQWNAQAIR